MIWVAFLSFFILSSPLGVTLAASPWPGPRIEDCEPKICGQTNVTYPFLLPGTQPSYCGFPSFGLSCDNNVPTIQISGQGYYIQSIFYQNQSMLVANTDYVDGSCPVAHLNVSLDLSPFNFSSANTALFFSYCPEPPPNQYRVPCASTNTSVYLGGSIMPSHINSSNSCDIVVAPVLAYPGANSSDYATLLKNGFLLDWTVPDCTACKTSGGRCGYANATQQFICICADGAYSTICASPHHPVLSSNVFSISLGCDVDNVRKPGGAKSA
ncbi:LEAF RUST 10 DISEASE-RESISTANCEUS RECEPTOR-LIKE PROTEIN KINASE-like 1.2 [Elaeis guineensis]|uniref:LEAF RUST 10 DISEASE-RESISTANCEUS RECEPTOR-LIKE PROTEIN KINASE-like 1.2 n=1 Tax=Elaeis guineensis var. tenera TaxID=51953 RepID=UPI003C6CDD63